MFESDCRAGFSRCVGLDLEAEIWSSSTEILIAVKTGFPLVKKSQREAEGIHRKRGEDNNSGTSPRSVWIWKHNLMMPFRIFPECQPKARQAKIYYWFFSFLTTASTASNAFLKTLLKSWERSQRVVNVKPALGLKATPGGETRGHRGPTDHSQGALWRCCLKFKLVKKYRRRD